MKIDCGEIRLAGFYTFELNGEKVFEAPSKNLITDFGWDRLSNLSTQLTTSTVVQVGTGNTAPALGDTSLQAFLAQVAGSTTTIGTGTDGTGGYSFTRGGYVFAQGAVIGNIAEVGFKVATGDGSLSSRSLVKDGLGNPAVIVVTAMDQLTVNYELRYYRAALDVSSTVLVAGVNTTYILRTASPIAGIGGPSGYGGLNISKVYGTIYGSGSVLGAPGIDVSGSTNTGIPVQTVVSKSITVNPTNTVVAFSTGVIGTADGNVTGGCLNYQFSPTAAGSEPLGAYGNIKMNFSPAIPKTNTKTLQFSFSFTFTRL